MVKQNRQKRHLHVARENIYNHPRSLLHPQSFLTPIIVFKSVGMISFPAEQNILKWNIPDRNSKENNCKNKEGADFESSPADQPPCTDDTSHPTCDYYV